MERENGDENLKVPSHWENTKKKCPKTSQSFTKIAWTYGKLVVLVYLSKASILITAIPYNIVKSNNMQLIATSENLQIVIKSVCNICSNYMYVLLLMYISSIFLRRCP